MDVSPLSLATAFAAGTISFLSPCVLPLVPGYLSYVAGTSLESLRDDAFSRQRALRYAVAFVFGFSLVFVLLGAGATAVGGYLLERRFELSLVAGALILLFGLQLSGALPTGWLEREARFRVDIRGGRFLGAGLMGMAFAFGWTPCIGPILGAILTMSAGSGEVGTGMTLLAFYALGLGTPFLLAAMFTDVLLVRMRRWSRAGMRLQRGAGVLLAVAGLLILTGRLELIAYWLLDTFPAFAHLG